MQQKTAVEWLQEQINLTFYVAEASEINKRFQSICEQAKAMEKDQIENAWNKRILRGTFINGWHIETKNGEEYYNETYNNKNK